MPLLCPSIPRAHRRGMIPLSHRESEAYGGRTRDEFRRSQPVVNEIECCAFWAIRERVRFPGVTLNGPPALTTSSSNSCGTTARRRPPAATSPKRTNSALAAPEHPTHRHPRTARYDGGGRAARDGQEVWKNLSRFFNWCIDRELVHANPLDGLRRSGLSANYEARRALGPTSASYLPPPT